MGVDRLEWATNGRFHGRWDDHDGNFRTLYVGQSLLACLIELLADFRPDPMVEASLEEIDEDPADARDHPTAPCRVIDPSWCDTRCVGTGSLTGRFCVVAASATLAALHPQFVGTALRLGLKDFDAAAVKDGRVRALTQAIATHLHRTTSVNGVRFNSRHGDDLCLWAIFERADDRQVTSCVTDTAVHALSRDDPDLAKAMHILGLSWRDRNS